MKIRNKLPFLYVLCFLLQAVSCTRFLDAKPDESLVIPHTLDELLAILDNTRTINGAVQFSGLTPSLGEIGADDYYMNDPSYLIRLSPYCQDAYIWARPFRTAGEDLLDWNLPYQAIFYANVVLQELDNMVDEASTHSQIANLRGMALFHNAHMYTQLVQVFAPPYDPATASTVPGLPLRLMADVNEQPRLATLEETYAHILTELKNAAGLLPVVQAYPTRPSRAAAFGLLARTYLSMGNFVESGRYADSCLQLTSSLLNFNDVKDIGSSDYPFPRFNEEVIFHCLMLNGNYTPVVQFLAAVDSNLYASYGVHDLRKTLYYINPNTDVGGHIFRGGYDGNWEYFSGIATDEIYLIKAECLARQNKVGESLETLNTVLEHRYEIGYFTPYADLSQEETISLVLAERRKELHHRGLRWMDLRRLNQEAVYAKTLQRQYKGQLYQLPPNDARYTYPFPDNVSAYLK